MARMGALYTAHGCDTMTAGELAGLQSLMVVPSQSRPPLTADELGALHASPKLRAWLLPQLGGYGHYALHALLAGVSPIGLAEFLGLMRPEIASAVNP